MAMSSCRSLDRSAIENIGHWPLAVLATAYFPPIAGPGSSPAACHCVLPPPAATNAYCAQTATTAHRVHYALRTAIAPRTCSAHPLGLHSPSAHALRTPSAHARSAHALRTRSAHALRTRSLDALRTRSVDALRTRSVDAP
eukprot:scaffold33211_cov33-Tisochrysis_lutea.AAC.1